MPLSQSQAWHTRRASAEPVAEPADLPCNLWAGLYQANLRREVYFHLQDALLLHFCLPALCFFVIFHSVLCVLYPKSDWSNSSHGQLANKISIIRMGEREIIDCTFKESWIEAECVEWSMHCSGPK